MSRPKTQKLYCYVDESGQDPRSAFFVVVAVVSDQHQDDLREKLSAFEQHSRTGFRKWHKSQPERRQRYLKAVLDQGIGTGEVFFGHYEKPVPYFFPMLDVLEQALKRQAKGRYSARVYVDGIDRKKAAELTGALRAHGLSLGFVKSRRDESEPAIRLADMWAGCIRAALLGRSEEQRLLERAQQAGYLVAVTQQKTPQ